MDTLINNYKYIPFNDNDVKEYFKNLFLLKYNHFHNGVYLNFELFTCGFYCDLCKKDLQFEFYTLDDSNLDLCFICYNNSNNINFIKENESKFKNKWRKATEFNINEYRPILKDKYGTILLQKDNTHFCVFYNEDNLYYYHTINKPDVLSKLIEIEEKEELNEPLKYLVCMKDKDDDIVFNRPFPHHECSKCVIASYLASSPFDYFETGLD